MVSIVRGVKKLLGADTSKEEALIKKYGKKPADKAAPAKKQAAPAQSKGQKRANQAADSLGGISGKAVDTIRKRKAAQAKALKDI